jgi:hypothetical protein
VEIFSGMVFLLSLGILMPKKDEPFQEISLMIAVSSSGTHRKASLPHEKSSATLGISPPYFQFFPLHIRSVGSSIG